MSRSQISPEEIYHPFGGDELDPVSLEDARAVVLPLCYETAVSYGTGCGQGPLHLLAASVQLEVLDEETLVPWGKAGIHTLPPLFPRGGPRAAVARMAAAAAPVLERGQFLLTLGGDHAVSIGPISAAAARWPDMAVLQVDAHLDLRDSWNGSRYNHACVMRRVADDMGLAVVQVGIRAVAPEEADFLRARGLKPFWAHDIAADSGWIDAVAAALPERVYLTVDLDGLDPSVIPGTGTPEPGGLTYRQLIALIRAVGSQRTVVAADIVELAKIPGTQVSEFTAARIAAKIFACCL